MNAKRMFYVMIGVIVLVIGLTVLGVYYGNGMLTKQSRTLVGLRLQSEALDAQATALAHARQDIVKYDTLNKIAETVVPQDKDQAQTVRELVAVAQQNKISIGSITFPSSSLGQTKNTKAATTQLTPVAGMAGVYQLPITLESDSHNPISFAQLISFLNTLENNRHTAQVAQLTLTPADDTGSRLSFTIVVNTYVKP